MTPAAGLDVVLIVGQDELVDRWRQFLPVGSLRTPANPRRVPGRLSLSPEGHAGPYITFGRFADQGHPLLGFF